MQRWFDRLQPLFLVLGLLFVGLLLRSQWPTLRAYPWQFHPEWLLFSALAMLLSWSIEVCIWHQLLRIVGGVVPYGATLRMWFLAALIRYIPGNVWQLLSLTLYCRRWGVRPEATLASIVLYQAVVILAVAPIALLYFGLTGNWGLLTGFVEEIAGWLLGLAALPVLVFLLRPGWLVALMNWALGKLGRAAIDAQLGTAQLLQLLLIGVVDWLCWGATFAGLALALGRPSTLGLGEFAFHLIAVYSIGYAIGFLSLLTPSGFGVREGTYYLLLTPLLAGGYVAAIALAMRLWNIFGEVVMALLTVLAERLWPLSVEGAAGNIKDAESSGFATGPSEIAGL
ncbi:MAG: flippase-like domain-containing protein [Caldilineaceae bacterium]|nr:flippase-like domain-containing protein [Caldilineaceae bacterium]